MWGKEDVIRDAEHILGVHTDLTGFEGRVETYECSDHVSVRAYLDVDGSEVEAFSFEAPSWYWLYEFVSNARGLTWETMCLVRWGAKAITGLD